MDRYRGGEEERQRERWRRRERKMNREMEDDLVKLVTIVPLYFPALTTGAEYQLTLNN